MVNKRINYIDIARGLAIIFIVFSHAIGESLHCKVLFKFLFSFHVVLFFVLSGYTFNLKEKNPFKFIKNKFLRIMIPYFIWALLFLIPYMLFGHNIGEALGINSSFNLKIQLKNILYGNGINGALKQNTSLWFLPALFSTEVLYYFIIKNIHPKNTPIKFILLMFLIIIAYLFDTFFLINLPWGINSAIVIGVFYYFGYLCKELNLFNKDKLFKKRYIFILIIIGLLSNHFNIKISYLGYKYGNLILAFLSGISFSIISIYIAFKINRNKILEYIGRNTLGILIFHKIIILIFN